MKTFVEIFEDKTKYGTKIKTSEYQDSGLHLIIDQGQKLIAGYTNLDEGLFEDVPAIIFGDHTRVVKYVEEPFFLGADGVKILKSKIEGANYKYLYYALKNAKIPDTGYNRHFKWLKEVTINYPDLTEQQKIVDILDKMEKIISEEKHQLEEFDNLIKSRFVEMFGDVTLNPYSWKKEQLQDHIDMITGYPFDSNGYEDTGIKICGGLIIMPDGIKWDECKHWPVADGYEKFLLQADDIVVALDRPWISEGFKIGMVREEDLPALLIQRTARIRGEDLEQNFLLYLLKDEAFESQCRVTGSLVPHISNKDINNYEVIIPPLKLQQQFTAFVHQTDKLKFSIRNLT